MEIELFSVSTSDEGERSALCCGHFILGESISVYLSIGG